MKHILNKIIECGGSPYFVGGCVRDQILGIESKDIDIEVFNISPDKLINILSQFGKVDSVGVSFGVVKLTTENQSYDFSLPRTDSKTGKGYKGFNITVDHNLTVEQAAKRRDFTINAISKDVDGNILDPFNGKEDLQNKVLRATSEHFAEDPLRVLRGFQFAGRFNMKVDPSTSSLCNKLIGEFKELSLDRIFTEWVKWALKSTKPSAGLHFLSDTGWLSLFPELNNLKNLNQDSEFHPEGDVLTHTGLVVDEAVNIANRDNLSNDDRLVLVFAALCHDLGKANTTEIIEGRWRSPGHANSGKDLTRSFMESIGFVGHNNLRKIVDQVVVLVGEHMVHIGCEANLRTVRRLSSRLHPTNISQLVRLIESDHSGRSPIPKGVPESAAKILEIAQQLFIENSKPSPILMGKHLINMGFTPSPKFKHILDEVYKKQLDGDIFDLRSAKLYVAYNFINN